MKLKEIFLLLTPDLMNLIYYYREKRNRNKGIWKENNNCFSMKNVRLKKVGKIHYRSQLMNVSEVPVDYKVNKTKLDI